MKKVGTSIHNAKKTHKNILHHKGGGFRPKIAISIMFYFFLNEPFTGLQTGFKAALKSTMLLCTMYLHNIMCGVLNVSNM